jgi:hypothetical protein
MAVRATDGSGLGVFEPERVGFLDRSEGRSLAPSTLGIGVEL